MLKIYEIESFFYIEKRDSSIPKTVGTEYIALLKPPPAPFLPKEKIHQARPDSMSCISFDQRIFSDRKKYSVGVFLC